MAQKTTTEQQYVVHCLAMLRDGQWQAFSLEYGLAVQADSLAIAKKKLDGMIHSYLYDALFGEDRDHAKELLGRKAHWRVYLRYYLAYLAQFRRRSMTVELFSESLGTPELCG